LVGAKIIAIIGLISGFINLLLDVTIIVGDSRALTNGFDRKLYFRFATFPVISYFFEYIGTIPTMTIFILVTLLVLICNLLMFCGTLKKKPGLIIPWLVTMLILNILFSIYTVAVILIRANILGPSPGSLLSLEIVSRFVYPPASVSYILIVSVVINVINYWIWDVVKSAYKQIKDENTANSFPNAYAMNVVTDQKYTAPM